MVRLSARIGRAVLEAKQTGGDPFATIEAIMSWERVSESVTEAETRAQPKAVDDLSVGGDEFSQLRRYTPAALPTLDLTAAPAARDGLEAVDVLKGRHDRQARKRPDDPPMAFVCKRWDSLVRSPEGRDRRFYELWVLSERKNALRAGAIWVQGARQFKDVEDCLLPRLRFAAHREHRQPVDDTRLPHLSPLGWAHIPRTGDEIWRQPTLVEPGKFRPLRPVTGS